jgi:hypothetical protein
VSPAGVFNVGVPPSSQAAPGAALPAEPTFSLPEQP